MHTLFTAAIQVRQAGYRWVKVGEDVLGRLEDVQTPASSGQPFRVYDPFAVQPALFRIFAELGPIETFGNLGKLRGQPKKGKKGDQAARFGEAVLQFVNQYGLPAPCSPIYPRALLSGSAVAWDISQVRLALNLWEAAAAKNRKVISAMARWDARVGWQVTHDGYLHTPKGVVAAAFDQVLQPADEFPVAPGDEFALAMRIVEDLIAMNSHSRLTFAQQHPALLALHVVAEDLRSVMWLQLATAVCENKQYRHCEFCGKPFELGQKRKGRLGRDDQKYCEPTCRVKAYQQRQARARQMSAEGTKPRDIAKTLGVELGSVKKWLAE